MGDTGEARVWGRRSGSHVDTFSCTKVSKTNLKNTKCKLLKMTAKQTNKKKLLYNY